MIKIETVETEDGLKLKVEGRLAGAWVSELEECWRRAAETRQNKPVDVDLSGVTFIDQAGCYLLRLMRHEGASLRATGLMADELDDVLRRKGKNES